MKKLIIIGCVFLCSCHCQRYNVKYMLSETPVFVEGQGYTTKLCDKSNEEIGIRLSEEKYYYQLANDSTCYDYTATISYYREEKPLYIRVGRGSEFEIGKCRFRVIQVFDPLTIETVINKQNGKALDIYNVLALQLLEAPKRCACANKKLQAYDEKGLDPDWLRKIYVNYLK